MSILSCQKNLISNILSEVEKYPKFTQQLQKYQYFKVIEQIVN